MILRIGKYNSRGGRQEFGSEDGMTCSRENDDGKKKKNVWNGDAVGRVRVQG